MLPNLLIAFGLLLAAAGVWLKFRSAPEPAPVEVAAAPKQSPEEKGRAFENWVVSHLSKQHHVLKDWRSDKVAPNGTYAESNKYPDVQVALSLHGKEYPFAMECKWRNSFMGANVDISEAQLGRYRNFEREQKMPVFLVLGIGGQPNAPNELYCIPLRNLPPGLLDMRSLAPFRQKMTSNVFYYDAFAKELRL